MELYVVIKIGILYSISVYVSNYNCNSYFVFMMYSFRPTRKKMDYYFRENGT